VLVGLPRHGVVPRRRLRAASGRRALVPALPGRAPEYFDAVVTDAAGRRVLEIQVKQPRPPRTGCGAPSSSPAPSSARCTRSGCAATARDEYLGTLVNAWLAEGGEALGVRARRDVRGRRHAPRLPRGDPRARQARRGVGRRRSAFRASSSRARSRRRRGARRRRPARLVLPPAPRSAREVRPSGAPAFCARGAQTPAKCPRATLRRRARRAPRDGPVSGDPRPRQGIERAIATSVSVRAHVVERDLVVP
jgi:hypothetical protein